MSSNPSIRAASTTETLRWNTHRWMSPRLSPISSRAEGRPLCTVVDFPCQVRWSSASDRSAGTLDRAVAQPDGDEDVVPCPAINEDPATSGASRTRYWAGVDL